MADHGLTPKQEAFVQAYWETGNASEAYRRAYNTTNMKPASVNRLAFAQLENIKITSRLSELKADLARKTVVTVESLSGELDDALALALKNDQASAAVAAIMGKAKLHGMLIDKQEQRVTTESAQELMPDIRAMIERAKSAKRPEGDKPLTH